MGSEQALYDMLYEAAIQQGWSGWGGNDRLSKGPEQVMRILAKPYVPQAGKLLELGCGEGHLCRLLTLHGYEVTGVDISSVAIRWAHEKNALHHASIRYIHGDLSQNNFPIIDLFDLIVDGNCFHCIPGESRAIFLKNVWANLSASGIFFISSLCSQDTENHIQFRAGEPYRHIATSDNLRGEVQRAGFEILDVDIHTHNDRIYDHINLFLKKAQNHL